MTDPKDRTNTWDNVPRCYTICSWCTGLIRDGDRSSGVSHGICEPCMSLYFPEEYAKIREKGPTD